MNSQVPLDENSKRRLVLRLIARLRCTECGRLYDPADFVLVHRWQDTWVLSTRCRHCNDLCHVVVFMRLQAESEPAIELTPDELGAVDGWPVITADDVLDVHALLQEFDGDFQGLFTG
jgi:phage FluMu protein Com